MRGTSCRDAIRKWEEKNGIPPAEGTEVSLIGQIPPMDRIDDSLNQFENCTKLSLSTNAIDKMVSLPRLKNLKILSLGRNNIKKIQYLDDVAATLEELWMSYNIVDKLEGLQSLQKLHTLYISNNRIRDFNEIGKCAQLQELRSVLFQGNPAYGELTKQQNWPRVVQKIPTIENIDGVIVSAQTRKEAEELE